MNDNSDILLTTAKTASQDNPWAHLATQAISMGYDLSKLWYCNYQLGMAQAMGPGYMPAAQIQAMKQDRIKHTILLAIKCFGLIAAGICSLEERTAMRDYGRF